jgi:hypothetical protein
MCNLTDEEEERELAMDREDDEPDINEHSKLESKEEIKAA